MPQLPKNTDRRQDRVIREALDASAESLDPAEAADLIAALLDVIYALDSQVTERAKGSMTRAIGGRNR